MRRARSDNFRIVVIGASAGGVDALLEISRSLEPQLNSAVFIVVHTAATSSGLLPGLLDRAGRLTATRAEHRAEIEPGRIYVAPPDYHLTLERGRIALNHGPRENGFRPAVDPLFRSAAQEYGPRVVGIILSGGLNDGTHGLLAIKHAGGVTVAQEPANALNGSMPASAIRHVAPDHVLSAAEIGPLINRLDGARVRPSRGAAQRPRTHRAAAGPGTAAREAAARDAPAPPAAAHGAPARRIQDARGPRGRAIAEPGSVPAGKPTTLTCPECGGTLWEQTDGKLARYECRVGHAFSDPALSSSQAARVEAALWAAVRVLEESAAYLRRLVTRARGGRLEALAERYEARALEAEQRASLILSVLERPAPELEPDERAPATPPAPGGRTKPNRQSSITAKKSASQERPRVRRERR